MSKDVLIEINFPVPEGKRVIAVPGFRCATCRRPAVGLAPALPPAPGEPYIEGLLCPENPADHVKFERIEVTEVTLAGELGCWCKTCRAPLAVVMPECLGGRKEPLKVFCSKDPSHETGVTEATATLPDITYRVTSPGDSASRASGTEPSEKPLPSSCATGRPDEIDPGDEREGVGVCDRPAPSQRKTPSTLAVTFRRDRGGRVRGFEVSGHANFGTPGQDIVCAGVSALAQAALLGLEEFASTYHASEVRPGFLSARVTEAGVIPGAVYGIIRTFELGLSEIERCYPGWLTVTYEQEVSK